LGSGVFSSDAVPIALNSVPNEATAASCKLLPSPTRLSSVPYDHAGRQNDVKAGQNDVKAGQNDVKAGRDDLEAGRNELKAGSNELKAGSNELKAPPTFLPTDRNEVRTGRKRHRAALNELRPVPQVHLTSQSLSQNWLLGPLSEALGEISSIDPDLLLVFRQSFRRSFQEITLRGQAVARHPPSHSSKCGRRQSGMDSQAGKMIG
jgi:hypothetical protein